MHTHAHTHLYILVHVQKNNRQGVHIRILTVTILSMGIRKNLIFALFDQETGLSGFEKSFSVL